MHTFRPPNKSLFLFILNYSPDTYDEYIENNIDFCIFIRFPLKIMIWMFNKFQNPYL